MPALPVTSNGTIDASTLGIAWDVGLNGVQQAGKAVYIANLTASIRTWETVSTGYGKPLSIANLDLTGTAPTKTFVITVGNGDSAPSPYKELAVSHVDLVSKMGYFFFGKNGTEGAHEFGHLLGLADRYFEVYSFDSLDAQGERDSAPMARMMFGAPDDVIPAATEDPKATPRYYPATNLMSNDTASDWTLSQAQLDFIFSGTDEPSKPRNVVAIKQTTATSGTLHLPSPADGIVLTGGFLYAGPDGITPLAAYRYKTTTGLTKMPVPAIAAPIAVVKGVVTTVTNHRGPSKPKKIEGQTIGVRYKHHTKSQTIQIPGDYIHRQQMNLVGELAK